MNPDVLHQNDPRPPSQARFAFGMPPALPPAVACPLMCAGGTVFEPITSHLDRRGMNVAIGSIGGLVSLRDLIITLISSAALVALARSADW